MDLRESSRKDAFHTSRAQSNAPTKILFDNFTITARGKIPFYIAPGSTFISLKNSEIVGNSDSTAIYLDAESSNNFIINNNIHPSTTRELIAIDASANNLIQGNYFSSLSKGGINLYRNCGEGGTIRHQSPVNNKILDNRFYYKDYAGISPGIHIASRMGFGSYCDQDAGFPWGSSVDNFDHAQYNIIAYNYFTAAVFNIPILNTGDATNLIINTTTVSSFPSNIEYSCFDDESRTLLTSGDSFMKKANAANQSVDVQVKCVNGVLVEQSP